jgi:SagB-type dehydrogenase family enzyme
MNWAGEFYRLAEPLPREAELCFRPYQFAVKARRLLPAPENVPSPACLHVLHGRCSRRTFETLPEERLATLLWFTAKTLRVQREPSGFGWQHRPAPSSGGRHPIYPLVLIPAIDPLGLSVYEPESHALLDLEQPEASAQLAFLERLEAVLSPQSGTVIWFAADFLRTASRYESCESLVWRDAGALLATICIAAEAMSLNCCAYGITGEAWISQLFPPNRFIGVGGCVVGMRP